MGDQTQKPEGYLDGEQIDRIEAKAHLLRGQAFADTFHFLFGRKKQK